MLGKGDWGVYQDAVPTAIIESFTENNEIVIRDRSLRLSYNQPCPDEEALISLHNKGVNMIDVCDHNQIRRFFGYEKSEFRFEKIETPGKPDIKVTSDLLLLVDGRGNILRMYIHEGKQTFLDHLRSYLKLFEQYQQWEDHLEEKKTIADGLIWRRDN